MRSFGETLPTMRDTDGAPAAGAGSESAGGEFGPNAILKALKARSAAAPPRAAAGSRDTAIHRAMEGRNPFDPAQLPRRSASPPSERPFAKTLAAAIEPFDVPAPKAQAPDQAAESEAAKRMAAERERIAEEAREDERRKMAELLAAEKDRWAQEVAESLSAQLDQAFVDLHNRLSDAITQALTPVLEDAMRARAISRFSASLERLAGRAAGSTVQPITVRGPQSLLNALTAVRSGDTAGLKLVASDDCELVASVNETTLRTTIKAWATTIAAAAGTRHGKE